MIERFTLLLGLQPATCFLKSISFILLLSCLFPEITYAQPTNDDCANAVTITDLSGGCSTNTLTGATTDLLNGNCAAQGATAVNSWFQFTAIGTDLTVISNGPGGIANEITIIEFNPNPCDFASAAQVACSASPLTTTGLLTPGNTYYIVITDPNNTGTNINICVTNPLVDPPPPNDDPCNAQNVAANGNCTSGTTEFATSDWTIGDPACTGLDQNSVWYSTTLSPTMDALEVNVQSFGGNVMVIVGTFAPDCNGTYNVEGYYCGGAGTPVNVTGLMENTQYYVMVSTASANQGTFDVCMTETGIPVGCSVNNFCNLAEGIPTPTTGVPCTPITGCNIGASSEPGLQGCSFATEEVVWYSFTSDNTAGLLSASVVSMDISQPSIQVFSGSCGGLQEVSDCATGANGEVSLVNESISPNATYYIAVSNSFGPGGYFDLCIQTFGDISSCATESNLYVSPGSTSFGSPDEGPYQPGETVTMCFDLITYHADPIGTGNDCQWLQGIVPVFGDCWDPTAFDPAASEPPSLYGGNWDWHTNITYNNANPNITIADCDGDGDTDLCHITEPSCCNAGTAAGQIVPPGWFADMGGSPNNTFGDGNCCNCNMGPWSFCFDLTTKLYPECDQQPSFTDCSVKIYTFADGETGSWNGGASTCAQDVPQIQNAALNCCVGPTINYQEAQVCSGGALFLPLSSDQDPNVNYSWTVDPPDSPPNPNSFGAFSGEGSSINQTLTNNTGSPVVITYTVFGANTTEGCVGTPIEFPVTIYPDLFVDIDPVLPVCAGECAALQANPSGGSGNYVNYVWDQGLPSGSPGVSACPSATTTYSVTVTDNLGCTGVGTVTVAANSNLQISIAAMPGVETCQDFNNPTTITATVDAGGSGNYGYSWSGNTTGGGGSADAEVVYDSDTYCVVITDFTTNCTGQACIDITINPLPLVIIIDPPSQICVSTLQYDFDAIPDPNSGFGTGVWGGVADPNGSISPDLLGAGQHQVTYEFTDLNGCYDIAVYDFLIEPLPNTPEAISDVFLCTGVGPQNYSIAAVPNAFTYTWVIPADATLASGQGTTGITIDWGPSLGGQVCVTANNDCGSSPQSCFDVTIGSGPTPPAPPADVSFCSGAPAQTYSVTAIAGITYLWTVPAAATITGGQTTNSITVDWGTAPSGQVCVTAGNSCGTSAQACANVTIENVPAAPSPPADATICAGLANDTYSISTVATAIGYTWTIPAGATIVSGQGTTSLTINWETATSGQVCITADNACGSSPLSCFDVTIGDIPLAPNPPADAVVCAGTANSNYAIAPVTSATDYTWTVPAGATITNGQGTTSINIDWATATTGQVCVTANNNCGNSPLTCFNVTVENSPPSPVAPLDALICAGLQGDSYSIAAVAGATSYTWSVPAGASITSGQSSTDIDINWAANVTSDQICVTADNNCGMSPPVCFNITIENAPPAAVAPADAIICEGLQNDTYTITAVTGATDYTWTVPNGASISNGQGTTDIDIDWGTASSGQVCTTPSNNCGDGPETCFDVIVNTTPQAPIAPANAVICEGLQNDNYSINTVAGATAYTWTVPANATISNGQGSNAIDIDWGTASSGQVCVTADNDCGNSPQACFDVTIDQAPPAPTPPTDAAVCANTQGQSYSIAAVAGATDYTWTTDAGASIASGQGTTNVTIDYGTAGSTIICVTANNNCGSSPDACFTTTINPIPNALFNVDSPICADGTATVNYLGTASPSATYTWSFNGGNNTTGASGPGPYVIDWNADGVYNISLTVSENGCISTQEIQAVIAEAPLPEPVINCLTTTSSVEFTWIDIPGATGYLVDGTPQAGTSYTVTGLNSGDMVTITVTAVGNGACGDSEASQTCSAQDCPVVQIDIDQVTALCLDNTSAPFSLTAVVTPPGLGIGTWSGNGITDMVSGTFDPNDAAVQFGNNVITYTYTDGPCSYSQVVDIQVNAQPTADFTLPSPICAEDTIIISYTGSATATATYNWDFGNADYITGSASGPYQVHWPAGTNETVTLTVTSISGCPSEEMAQTMVIDAPLDAPVIICNSTTDNIDFSWSDIPGSNGYLVNGVPQSGTTYSATGISAGEMVSITVIAIGTGSCGDSQASATCTADDCPPILITIDAIAPICLDANATSFNLVANVGGGGTGTGQWQGPGITNATTGLFNPNAATVIAGINTVTYFYNEGPCSYSESIDIIVNEQPAAEFIVESPACAGDNILVTFTGTYDAAASYIWDFGNGTVITDLGQESYELLVPTNGIETITLQVDQNNCASEIAVENVQVDAPLAAPVVICNTATTSIEFTWDPIPGANGYTVNGVPQGSTTYNATGLNTGDMVTIDVVAIGSGACGNSMASATCTAEDCPPVQIDIDPVSSLCQGSATINLVAIITGGNNGSGLWSGPGITDPVNGVFDPSAFGVNIGNNIITYTYSEPPCNYTGTVDIVVNDIPSANFSIDATACVNDLVNVSYLGTYSGTATYNWDFGNAVIVSDLGQENYTISFPNGGNLPITLDVTNNGCNSGQEVQNIQIDEPLAVPNISCTPTLNSVEFTWDPIPGATGYIVNGATQSATNFEFTGLNAGDVVNITVIAIGNGPCGNSMATADCEASDCAPVTLTISPVTDICRSSQSSGIIDLEAAIAGGTGLGTGTWVGNGITNATTGLFDPDNAAVINGANVITFFYNEDGCDFSESITINVYDQPTADAGPTDILSCANNQMVTLSGSGSGDPMWSGPGIDFGGDTYSPVVNTSGDYTLTVTDPISGCTNTSVVSITADNSVPIAFAGEDAILDCNNNVTLNLMADGTLGPDYELTWIAGPSITAANMNDPNPEIDQPGMYILSIENTVFNCVSEPDTVLIGLDTLPPNAVILFTGSLDCEQSVTLTAEIDPNSTHSWEGPDGTISTELTIEAAIGGTYILYVIDNINGCTNFAVAEVTDLTSYPIASAGDDQVLDCSNENVSLSGSNSQTGPTIIYSWTGPVGGISGPTDEIDITVVLPGMYIITVEDDAIGCMNSDTVLVIPGLSAPIAEAGESLEFGCSEVTLTLDGSGSVGNDTFQWTDANGQVISNTAITDIENPGWYYLSVLNAVGCDALDSVFIGVSSNVPYDVLLSITAPTCFGDNDGLILVDTVLGGMPPYTYSLNDGESFNTFPILDFLEGGTYTLTIEDSDGCTYDTEVFIPVPDSIEIYFNTDLTIELGNFTNINTTTNIPAGAIDTIIWSPIEFLNCADSVNCFNPTTDSLMYYTTTFQALVIDTFGCKAIDEVTINVNIDRPVYIPNAFSPNEDGNNDKFMIESGRDDGIEEITFFRIFNRWGELVFEAENFQPNDPDFAWDGRFKGSVLNPGVFVYVAEIEFIDGFKVVYKGDVSIMK